MNEKSRKYFLPQQDDEKKQNEAEQSSEKIKSIPNKPLTVDALIEQCRQSMSKDNTSTKSSFSNTSGFTNSVIDVNRNDEANIYSAICNMIVDKSIIEQLGDNIITFAGDTDSYWKDLEPKGKKFMIISMGSGDYVRSAGVTGGDKSYVDVTNKFIILDGIDYKSKSPNNTLMYMEV